MGPGKPYKLLGTAAVFLVVMILNFSIFKVIFVNIGQIDSKYIMGGILRTQNCSSDSEYVKGLAQPDDQYIERYLRPSSLKALDKKYLFNKSDGGIPEKFSLAQEVVRAYFDILSDASNMVSRQGGCGSIGFEKTPYPAAYGLLSESYRNNLTYEKFLKSFEGIGHINLIKIAEAPAVKSGDQILSRFFVEIETIEGSDKAGKTYFAYYYGYVSAWQEKDNGWRINQVELTSEDFLCHAYHGWWHDASSIVEIQYGEKCDVIDKILGVEEDGLYRNVIAKGKDGKQYRFMFIRITNGADIEFRQFVMTDGKWKETRIDTSKCNEENK